MSYLLSIVFFIFSSFNFINAQNWQEPTSSSASCILKKGSEDIKSLFESTISTLKSLKPEEGHCSTSVAAGNTLSDALNDYGEILKSTTSDGTKCSRYETTYKVEYESALVAVSNNLPLDDIMKNFGSDCIYLEKNEQLNCVQKAYAERLIEGQEECKEVIKNQRNSNIPRARINAIRTVSSSINDLITQVGSCDKADIRSGLLGSVLNIATSVSSASLGGLDAVAVSFLGGISSSLMKLFDKVDDIDILEKEQQFKDLGCLFINSQKRRCLMNTNITNLSGRICSGVNTSLNSPANSTGGLLGIINNVQEKSSINTVNPFMKAVLGNNFRGKRLESFLEYDVERVLRLNGSFEKLSSVMNYKKTLIKYRGSVNKMKQLSRGDGTGLDEALNEVKELQSELAGMNLPDLLESYFESIGTGNGLEKKLAYEIVNDTTAGFASFAKMGSSEVNDNKQMDLITSAMVNKFRSRFKDHLEITYTRGLKSARGVFESSPREALVKMQSIIQECIMTSGAYYMATSSDKGEYSTSKMERNPDSTYRKICEQFQCQKGIPPVKRGNPTEFKNYQCQVLYSPESIMNNIQEEYERSGGKFCGRSLSELHKP